jgi:DNA invertase Pin-like site-specific DNA recombinase
MFRQREFLCSPCRHRSSRHRQPQSSKAIQLAAIDAFLTRDGDALVVRWIERLGRNYHDVCDTIREFMRRGVLIRAVINSMTDDGEMCFIQQMGFIWMKCPHLRCRRCE